MKWKMSSERTSDDCEAQAVLDVRGCELCAHLIGDTLTLQPFSILAAPTVDHFIFTITS